MDLTEQNSIIVTLGLHTPVEYLLLEKTSGLTKDQLKTLFSAF